MNKSNRNVQDPLVKVGPFSYKMAHATCDIMYVSVVALPREGEYVWLSVCCTLAYNGYHVHRSFEHRCSYGEVDLDEGVRELLYELILDYSALGT